MQPAYFPSSRGKFPNLSLLALTALLFCQSFVRQGLAEIERVSLSPTKINIGGFNRRQQLLATAINQDGRKIDVTRSCQFTVRDPKIVSIVDSVVYGLRDGDTTIEVQFGARTATVEVHVEEAANYPEVNFRRDIIPLLSKAGCNGGGCHGKQSGQNGFKLSVFGFDPASDFVALVKEGRGRRVFPADPANSLIVRKATSLAPHGGGRRIEPDSEDYERLVQWIRQGAPWGSDNYARVARLEIEPRERIMGFRADQQILVTATYDNGQRRDVTDAAAYSGNAEIVAKVNSAGLVQTGEIPGEVAVTVNYMGQVGVARFVVPLPGAPDPYPLVKNNNRIDELVSSKLKKMGIIPSETCDDATFLRRLYLDTIGTLPTANEVRSFLANGATDKRASAIEAVLKRTEYIDYWTLKWADILLVDRKKLGERGAYEFHSWLRKQVEKNRPYDEWTRELITATGYADRNGPVNFYRAVSTPEDATRSISQAFLGVRMDCAQCHHHPFDRWGQEDFYAMAGYFVGLKRKAATSDRELIYHSGEHGTKVPLKNIPVKTRPLSGEPIEESSNTDPRIQLADWITKPENPWFARLLASRLWKHFLGRGLVEPEDDLRMTNPATNEALLAYLTSEVVKNDFNIKSIIRMILNSRTYQRSSVPNATNAGDHQNFSRHYIRRMPAEVLLDAICQATGSPERFPGMRPGTRAIQLWDNRLPSYFLETFGRSQRTSPCECGKSSEPTMSQALHLMNAPEVEAKITDPAGRIAKLRQRGISQEKLIDELCFTALGRPPKPKELKVAKRLFAQQTEQRGAEDFLWTLLNSYDFLFNQ